MLTTNTSGTKQDELSPTQQTFSTSIKSTQHKIIKHHTAPTLEKAHLRQAREQGCYARRKHSANLNN